MIVEEEPRADHPRGPQVRLVRQHEFERPDDVRRDPEERFALGERLGDEAELEILQVAKSTVDDLGGSRRGLRGKIALLDQQHLQAAPGGIARNSRAVDAAADDQQIVMLGVHAGVDSMSTSELILRESARGGDREPGHVIRPRGPACLRIRAMQRNVLIPLIVACSLFMENMDSTVIATSLPAIALDIGESPLARKLALTSSLVGLAVFIPITGWVADRLGSRTVFASAIVVFVARSLLVAGASNLPRFGSARFLHGIGAGMLGQRCAPDPPRRWPQCARWRPTRGTRAASRTR